MNFKSRVEEIIYECYFIWCSVFLELWSAEVTAQYQFVRSVKNVFHLYAQAGPFGLHPFCLKRQFITGLRKKSLALFQNSQKEDMFNSIIYFDNNVFLSNFNSHLNKYCSVLSHLGSCIGLMPFECS